MWTKFWGNGRVFYNSLGHHDDVFDKSPAAGVLMERGLVWAAEGRQYALDHGLTAGRLRIPPRCTDPGVPEGQAAAEGLPEGDRKAGEKGRELWSG